MQVHFHFKGYISSFVYFFSFLQHML